MLPLQKNLYMAKRIELYFPSADKLSWLRNISNYSFVDYEQGSELIMLFHKIQDIESLTPIHIVTLACFIDNLDRKGVKVKIKKDNEVASFLCNEVKLSEYWAGGKNYVPASRDSIFNLWRIIDNQKEVYSRLIHDYLKKEFFHNKDLGAVKNSIDEVCYNIFDHADAKDNAFSFVKFDITTEKLFVAVCDFGIGIATSVKNATSITCDCEAVRKAMEYKFTVGSQKHNQGMGLGNILETCFGGDEMCIVSNKAMLNANTDEIKVNKIDFYFPGTLIFYELSLSHFEDEEIIDNFEL